MCFYIIYFWYVTHQFFLNFLLTILEIEICYFIRSHDLLCPLGQIKIIIITRDPTESIFHIHIYTNDICIVYYYYYYNTRGIKQSIKWSVRPTSVWLSCWALSLSTSAPCSARWALCRLCCQRRRPGQSGSTVHCPHSPDGQLALQPCPARQHCQNGTPCHATNGIISNTVKTVHPGTQHI